MVWANAGKGSLFEKVSDLEVLCPKTDEIDDSILRASSHRVIDSDSRDFIESDSDIEMVVFGSMV
jgi:hypothetical protein